MWELRNPSVTKVIFLTRFPFNTVLFSGSGGLAKLDYDESGSPVPVD